MEDKNLNKKHKRSKSMNKEISISKKNFPKKDKYDNPIKKIKKNKEFNKDKKQIIPVKKVKLIKQIREEVEKKLNDLLKLNLNQSNLYQELVNLTYQDNSNEQLIYYYIKLYYQINLKQIDNKEIFDNFFFMFRYLLSPNFQKKLKVFEKYSTIFNPIKKISVFFNYIKNKKFDELKDFIEKEKKDLNINEQKNYPKFILEYNINNKHMFLSLIYCKFLNIDLKTLKNNFNFINIYEEDLTNIIKGKYSTIEIYYIFFMFNYYNKKQQIFLPAIYESKKNFKDLQKTRNCFFELNNNLLTMNIYNEKIFTFDNNKISYYNISNNINNNNYYYLYYYYLYFKDSLKINYFFFNTIIENYYYENLKKFLQSKIMQDIYDNYKEEYNLNSQKVYFEYLFKTDKAFEELKENMYFLPFSPQNNIKRTASITSRDIMKIFIFTYPIIESENTEMEKLVNYLLNYGYFNLCSFHESGGHYLFSYYYYLCDRDNNSYLTSKNNKMYNELKKNSNLKGILDTYDRGDLLEGILFGERIEKLYLFGAIYLLTDFYEEKDIETIKNNFTIFNNPYIDIDKIEIKESNLLKEIFKKFNTSMNSFLNAIKDKNNENFKESNICRNFGEEYIDVSLRNDTRQLFTNRNQGISPLIPPP